MQINQILRLAPSIIGIDIIEAIIAFLEWVSNIPINKISNKLRKIILLYLISVLLNLKTNW